MINPESLAQAYQAACEAELLAYKPGNVSIYSEAHDMSCEDFRASARASALPLTDPCLGLGEKIYRAIEATRQVVACNTNLGIVLLAAPLLQACQQAKRGQTLQDALKQILAQTTLEDADWVYQAIRLAAPAGLGDAEKADVKQSPQISLLEAMCLAQARDRVAKQYASGYQDIIEWGIPQYDKTMTKWGCEVWATLAVFVELLKKFPDSHIERKFGKGFNGFILDKMSQVSEFLDHSIQPETVLPLLGKVDAEFKAKGLNPGTTADLTVTTLLYVRLNRLLLEAQT